MVLVPLSFVRFSSLQHFLCFSCRLPAEAGGSLEPGAFPTCQPRSKAQKGEPESPQMGSPTPSPDSPARSSCQPSSPAESNTCNKNLVVSSQIHSDPNRKTGFTFNLNNLGFLCFSDPCQGFTGPKGLQLEKIQVHSPQPSLCSHRSEGGRDGGTTKSHLTPFRQDGLLTRCTNRGVVWRSAWSD